jgi:myo-inositol-1(or 4)-monophosphatase
VSSTPGLDLQRALHIALAAAQAGAGVIRKGAGQRESLVIDTKSPRDFVSRVDRDAEAAILAVLRAAYPEHAILAEETGASGTSHSPWQWVIDPLDGTTNFLHGVPAYAVSIALTHHGEPQVAVVLDVAHAETFTAVRGGGATLNDRPIHVTPCARLDESLIGTGFAFRPDQDFEFYARLFKAVAQRTAGLRRPGSAAIDLAWVACGRYDGFFEVGLKPWDMAAGHLLVTEAGGQVSDFAGASLVQGGQLAPSPLLASNGLLHEALRSLLASA